MLLFDTRKAYIHTYSKSTYCCTDEATRRSFNMGIPVSTRKEIREPRHTLCRLLPTIVNSGAKCPYPRYRAPPPIDQPNKKQTEANIIIGSVEPIPSHPIYHFVSTFVDSCITRADPLPSPAPRPPSPCRRSWRPQLRGTGGFFCGYPRHLLINLALTVHLPRKR